MSWSDPIADMLTRIRNGQAAGHEIVEMPEATSRTTRSRATPSASSAWR